jgi:hypothetical protein
MDQKKIKQIREGIAELGKSDAYEIYTGNVDSVDADTKTCKVLINDDLIQPDVRLRMATEGDVGMWILPKKGSYCAIAKMDGGTDYCLIQCSEIDKLYVKIGDMSFEMTKDGVVFNGGNNKGMVLTDKAVERWNKLEDDVNQLKRILSAWTPVAQDGGAALKAAAAPWFGAQLVKTLDTDVKNDKVKQ